MVNVILVTCKAVGHQIQSLNQMSMADSLKTEGVLLWELQLISNEAIREGSETYLWPNQTNAVPISAFHNGLMQHPLSCILTLCHMLPFESVCCLAELKAMSCAGGWLEGP